LATDNLDSELLLEGGTELLNPYHVIVVRGEKVNAACARKFATWITEPATQRQIKRFGVAEYGEPLFFPDAKS
jgi:tungstate transport system substrate-binding protein